MPQQFESVDDYISTFPLDLQTALQAVRKTINAAAPRRRLPGLLEKAH
jgi:uncharacterized protein YdhG (YjbR/CyaY superfamily)